MACLLDQSVGVYRPRHGIDSDFHRLVGEHFDEFRAVYANRYARKYGHWRAVFDKTVRRFLKCGDLQQGFARVRPSLSLSIPPGSSASRSPSCICNRIPTMPAVAIAMSSI